MTNNALNLTVFNSTSFKQVIENLNGTGIFKIVFCVFIFVVGVTGNSLVIFFFKFKKKKQNNMDYMLSQLAFTDLFASIFYPALLTYRQLTFYRNGTLAI